MNAIRLLRSLVCSLVVASSGPALAATDLVQFESCPRVSFKVERSGRLSSLMVIDQEHQVWPVVSSLLGQRGRRLDWLLLDEDESVRLFYSESVALLHQGSVSVAEFRNQRLATPIGTLIDERSEVVSERRIQKIALLSRPKADGSGDEYLALGEIMSLVDGCVINVSVLMPGATLEEVADVLKEVGLSGRPVKAIPTP